jgi:hypothetical protein
MAKQSDTTNVSGNEDVNDAQGFRDLSTSVYSSQVRSLEIGTDKGKRVPHSPEEILTDKPWVSLTSYRTISRLLALRFYLWLVLQLVIRSDLLSLLASFLEQSLHTLCFLKPRVRRVDSKLVAVV